MLKGIVTSLFLVGAGIWLGLSPVAAESGCPEGQTLVSTGSGVVCVVVTDPGEQPEAGRQGDVSETDRIASGCFKTDRTKVPCHTPIGDWWSGHQCYAAPYEAPRGSPAWQGHTDGSLWACSTCQDVSNSATCDVEIVWAAEGVEPGPPDPGELASMAVGTLPLARAEVQTAPRAADPTYVGVKNWLWVPRDQWQTISKTVTAGGTSVTVTAAPRQVLWDVGPERVTCYSSGRVWRTGMTDAATTSCGYTYETTSASRPNGRFGVSATIRYQVEWTCAGACTETSGSLGLVDAPSGNGSMRVLQRQTVVIQ